MISKLPKKSFNIRATFVRNIVTQNFQNSPNVTLLTALE